MLLLHNLTDIFFLSVLMDFEKKIGANEENSSIDKIFWQWEREGKGIVSWVGTDSLGRRRE